MNRPQDHAAGRSHERAVRLFATSLTTVIAEWRKLVAEVLRAFAGRRDRRGANKLRVCLARLSHMRQSADNKPDNADNSVLYAIGIVLAILMFLVALPVYLIAA